MKRPHSRYTAFVDYGDSDAYLQKNLELRTDFGDLTDARNEDE